MIVGTVAYTTCQGIAYLARDFHLNGVIQRVYTVRHPHYQSYPDRYRQYPHGPGYDRRTIREFLDGLDVLFLFETYLDPLVLRMAVERRIPIAVMPMYEYTPNPFPAPMALWLCPSLLDLDVYGGTANRQSVSGEMRRTASGLSYYRHGPGREWATFIPVPVSKPWKARSVARHFVHNAGHGQKDWAKGTPVVLEGIARTDCADDPNFRFTLRLQPGEDRTAHLRRDLAHHPAAVRLGDRLMVEYGDLPEGSLYETGDVFLNAERWNGLSLPLQEAFASGMLVMTTDRYPANTWLPKAPLIDVDRYERKRIAREFDEAIVTPQAVARAVDAWYGCEIGTYSWLGKVWSEENSWEKLKPLYLEALESIRRGR